MDLDRLIPPQALVDAHNEWLPLLHDTSQRRPYQAYCITEASSRPPSPDALIPRPLRIHSTHVQDILFNAQSRDSQEATLNTSLAQSAASIPGNDDGPAVSPKTESKSERQHDPSNQSPSTEDKISVNSNHIAQAVTPRDSHSLASIAVTGYNRTLSLPRVQQLKPPGIGTPSAVRRKPIQRQSEYTSIGSHPLPSLPAQASADPDESDVDFESQDERGHKYDSEQTLERTQTPTSDSIDDQSLKLLLTHEHNEADLSVSATPRLYVPNQSIAPKRSVVFDNEPPPPPPHNAYFRDWTRSPRSRDLSNGHAQFSSSDELYTLRGIFPNTDDGGWAQRRTQPKDTKLKYLFGQRPNLNLGYSQPSPLHVQSYGNPHALVKNRVESNDNLTIHPSTPPSLYSATDTRAGPRPPPWGSYESLEMQRWQRGDARERAQARTYRMRMDGTSSSFRSAQSTESLRKNTMRREVEEYRDAVLSVYPDMEFDGDAGRGGRSYCCVVM